MKSYVVGFMFNDDLSRVALIRKTHPAWQAGKMNGIGGILEEEERSREGMVREFEEETGLKTSTLRWRHFADMSGVNNDGQEFFIDFFATFGKLDHLKTVTEERIELVSVIDVNPRRADMIDNLPWLIGLARDHLHDRRPTFVSVKYC